MHKDNMEELRKNRFFVLIIAIVALEAILFSTGNFKLNEEERLKREADTRINASLQNIEIEAKALSVYDITENKKIYGRNDAVAMPLASLAKTMTVIVTLNNHSENDVVLISKDALRQAGDYGLWIGEKWEVGDLAKFTLLASANDGAYALAGNDNSFLEKMNDKAQRIGMDNTLFLNFTGLDLDLGQAGAFASAEDANAMAVYGLRAYPEIFSTTAISEINLNSVSGFVHNFKNTNTIIRKIPSLLFSKTGYTEIAGGNLTVVFQDRKGHYLAVTILGSSFLGRFSDMERIVETLYNM